MSFPYICTNTYSLKKILIIRFSSIGDIVLTTPLIRCLKNQLSDVELHYLTKKAFVPALECNPYLTKIHYINTHLNEVLSDLKQEKFDLVIDLHKNLRTFLLKTRLGVKSKSFNKLNFDKFLLVKFKINRLPKLHIVDRYLETVKSLGIQNDGMGLDYFISENDQLSLPNLPIPYRDGFMGAVIGGQHKTKLFPPDKWIELLKKIDKPIILLGGPGDFEMGEEIAKSFEDKAWNTCGKFSLNQSASLVKMADQIITNDTGLMHIAAAFKKPIVSLWGNTTPDFGMYPYLPQAQMHTMSMIQVHGLKCRPCSKIGYSKCPKSHFDCMNKIEIELILEEIKD